MKWKVVYEGGVSYPMTYEIALGYLNIFKDALYIERRICIWKWEIVIRRVKDAPKIETWDDLKTKHGRLKDAVRAITKIKCSDGVRGLTLEDLEMLDDDDMTGRRLYVISGTTIADIRELLQAL